MKIAVRIIGIRYLNELDSYWSNEDYIELLELFDFTEAEKVAPEELKEMVLMSITDFEPDEAAQMLLNYKLGNQLKKGQIESLSHEMQEDKVAEEYPEPELHFDLFNINQLLFKAYDGIFPNTEASVLDVELLGEKATQLEMTEEIMTKILGDGLGDNSILRRLYDDQIEGKEQFTDANKFIWQLRKTNATSYELVTSRYWIEKEDFNEREYEASVVFFGDNH